MRLALRLAERGLSGGELPIGAVLVRKDRVIAEAYCSDKRPRMLPHPELLTLIEADGKYPKVAQRRETVLYTNLEPCVMCVGAAMSFCLGMVVFGITAPADGAAHRLSAVSFGGADYPDYRMPIVIGGILKEESRSLFRAFLEKSRDAALVDFARGIVMSDSDDQCANRTSEEPNPPHR